MYLEATIVYFFTQLPRTKSELYVFISSSLVSCSLIAINIKKSLNWSMKVQSNYHPYKYSSFLFFYELVWYLFCSFITKKSQLYLLSISTIIIYFYSKEFECYGDTLWALFTLSTILFLLSSSDCLLLSRSLISAILFWYSIILYEIIHSNDKIVIQWYKYIKQWSSRLLLSCFLSVLIIKYFSFYFF